MGSCRELKLTNAGQLELLKGFAARGAPLRTTVLGASMWPMVRDGDVVTIAPFNGLPPRVGDVVAVVVGEPQRLLVHRVVRRDAAGWLIRGDACPRPDGVATRSQLLGRIEAVERRGRVVRFGTSGGGAGGAVISALSRSGVLGAAVGLWRRTRAAAAAGGRRVQDSRAYRRFARRVAPPVMLSRAAGVSRPDEGDGAVRATDWVAHWRGSAVGRVQLVVQADQADPWAGHWLSSLTVRSVVRGFGVGAALTGAVVEHARDDGAVEVLLAVHEDNARAIALYRKVGFERVVLPALEPLLADELERLGRRRVVMRLPLAARA